jgi:hypothetical protein
MKQFAYHLLASVGLLALVSTGQAQLQLPTSVQPHPLLKPVGTRLPQAVPSAGTPIGMIPGGRSPGLPTPQYNQAQRPSGQMINMSNVVAPYPGQTAPEPNVWEKLQASWFGLFHSEPATATRPSYTPGIARRNQERREDRLMRWLRD